MTTSAARTVTVPAALTATYGIIPGPTALRWPMAEPGDDLDYYIDATALLTDDVLEKVCVSVAPSGRGELIPWYVRADGPIICLRLFGGVPSRFYTVSVIATAASERRWQWLIGIQIDPRLATYPVPSPVCPGFGDSIMWPCSTPSYGPAQNLPPYTVAATGTTALTAAVVPILAITLINAGPGGGVLIGVQASTWTGNRPVFQNRAGGAVTLYPYAGDQFESQAAGAGITVQNDQTVTLSVAQSGAIIVS